MLANVIYRWINGSRSCMVKQFFFTFVDYLHVTMLCFLVGMVFCSIECMDFILF